MQRENRELWKEQKISTNDNGCGCCDANNGEASLSGTYMSASMASATTVIVVQQQRRQEVCVAWVSFVSNLQMDGNPSETKGSYEDRALFLGWVLFFQPTKGLSNPSCTIWEGLTLCTILQLDEKPCNLPAIHIYLNPPFALAHNIPCTCGISGSLLAILTKLVKATTLFIS